MCLQCTFLFKPDIRKHRKAVLKSSFKYWNYIEILNSKFWNFFLYEGMMEQRWNFQVCVSKACIIMCKNIRVVHIPPHWIWTPSTWLRMAKLPILSFLKVHNILVFIYYQNIKYYFQRIDNIKQILKISGDYT